jgi:hypothetical protein
MEGRLQILPRRALLLAALGTAVLLSCVLSGANGITSQKLQGDHLLYLPVVLRRQSTSTIIIDHRHTDASKIPPQWVAAAKQLTVHFAHTSHGSQVLTGLQWMEARIPTYAVHIEVSGVVVHPQAIDALNIYDGNNYPNNTYITPDMYWETAAGLNYTRSVVATGWFDISLWTWCGQMSYYSDQQVQHYLDALAQLQSEYPSVHWIYFTGHTDGSAPGSALWRHNEMARQYVQQNGGVLFDFADIESYDPAGTFYPNASDACEWCDDWCADHPSSFACQNVPQDCAHTHGLQCTLKAQAFWWLMARLAGWDGNPSQ